MNQKGGEKVIPFQPIFQAIGAVVDLIIEAVEITTGKK